MGFFDNLIPASVIANQAAQNSATATGAAYGNPPAGYTWVPAGDPNGHWERAKPGVTPNPSPHGAATILVNDQRGKTRAEIRSQHTIFVMQRAARLMAISQALTNVATVACGSKCAKPITQVRMAAWNGWPFDLGTLMAPYGFFIWDTIAFPVSSLQVETFTDTKTLTPEQQFAVDFQLYIRSIANFTRDVYRDELDWDVSDDGIEDAFGVRGNLETLMAEGVKIQTASGGRLETVMKHYSVNEILGLAPRWVVSFPGYSLNPIPPAASERTQQGGALKYIQRGGFFLDATVLRGEYPAQTKFMPTFGKGPNKKGHEFCKCGTQAMRLNVGLGGYRNIQVKVGANRSYMFTITPYDKPWYQDATSALAKLMRFLGDMICANQSMIQAHNSTLATTLCMDSTTAKPCKSGAPGCVCTPPTSPEQAAVTAANVAVSAWCKFWTKPPVPEEFPPALEETTEAAKRDWTWPVIIGAGLTAGAILASDKSR